MHPLFSSGFQNVDVLYIYIYESQTRAWAQRVAPSLPPTCSAVFLLVKTNNYDVVSPACGWVKHNPLQLLRCRSYLSMFELFPKLYFSE
nr:MAG TPA: hypothetical protein [Caudoviricetes sp.]